MRFIIIGLGNMGTKRLRVLGPRCVATVDPVNLAAGCRQIDDVLPNSFDAAVLSVPNHAKLELLRQLLAMGKHVLVEKPLLLPDVSTGEELAALAEETGAIWYTSYNHRFEPLVVRLKELLDQQAVGSLYHARMLYGNGTVQNSIGTWRDGGYGVLEDLGCHLIDLAEHLFGYVASDFVLWDARAIESHVWDRCVFAIPDRRIILECASTMWKNTFAIDVYGQLGSLHLLGLGKWGPTELLSHQRVFPSGMPVERREVAAEGDDTWRQDICEFERRVQSQQTSYASDLRISLSLHHLAEKAACLS